MKFDECHFSYGDFNSSDYRLVFAHLDTDIYTQLYGDSETTSIFNKKLLQNYVAGESFVDSVVEIESEIFTEDASPISWEDQRYIERHLFNQANNKKLYIDEHDDHSGHTFEYVNGEKKRIYLNCRLMKPKRILAVNNEVIGYSFTILTDSLMFWQDPVTVNHIFYEAPTGMSDRIDLTVDTDIYGYTWPEIKITVDSTGGDITIWNATDSDTRRMMITNCPPSGMFRIVCGKNYVSGNYYQKLASPDFLRLVNGKNEIRVTGHIASIEFKYQNRRFI